MKRLKKWGRTALQVGLLTLVSLAGNQVAAHLPWKVPGNVIGLVIMLVLLHTGVVRLQWVESGANWLLGEMLLFFIPATVGIVQYRDLIMSSGVRILLVIGVSTAAVMVCTGLVAEHIAQHRESEGGDGVGPA
jgi:holin-like protein